MSRALGLDVTDGAYRADIDGLRAIAVIAVVAYHAFPRLAPGGFVGVDVFFVISGYLITGLILRGIAGGTFRVSDFLDRRIRRIVPSLVVVLGVVLIAGWILLFPDEFTTLGRDAAAGSAFVSNLVFFHFRNLYFDTPAEHNPLIHLWSLGIEEQFYIVWPVTLLLLLRRSVNLRWSIVAMLAASIISIPLIGAFRPAAPFYFPITRGWELLIGAYLAVQASRSAPEDRSNTDVGGRSSFLIGSLGLSMIIGAALAPSRDIGYPWSALVPTLGTALVIVAGPDAWTNRHLLSRQALVGLGLISYPVYLWHWPVLVGLRLWSDRPTSVAVAIGIGASVLLATTTYVFVERPIRTRRARTVRLPLLVALGTTFIAGLTAYHGVWKPRSFPILGAGNEAPPHRSEVTVLPSGIRVVSAGAANPTQTILFIGDSHVDQYWPRVEALADRLTAERIRVTFAIRRGCSPLPSVDRLVRDSGCDSAFRNLVALATDSSVNKVVIGAYWESHFLPDFRQTGARRINRDLYEIHDTSRAKLTIDAAAASGVWRSFGATLAELKRLGKSVVVIGSNPTGHEFNPRTIIRRGSLAPAPFALIRRDEYETYVASVLDPIIHTATIAGAHVIDPMEFLCVEGTCPTRLPNGHPAYRDDDHIRAETARQLSLVDSIVWGSRWR